MRNRIYTQPDEYVTGEYTRPDYLESRLDGSKASFQAISVHAWIGPDCQRSASGRDRAVVICGSDPTPSKINVLYDRVMSYNISEMAILDVLCGSERNREAVWCEDETTSFSIDDTTPLKAGRKTDI